MPGRPSSRPVGTPQPRPSYTPPSATPRPAAPNRGVGGFDSDRGRSDAGRQPGFDRPGASPVPSPVGGSRPASPSRPGYDPAPAVGGRVRVVTPSERKNERPQLSPRDIYDRGSRSPGAGSGVGTKDRPLTSDALADRYRPRSKVQVGDVKAGATRPGDVRGGVRSAPTAVPRGSDPRSAQPKGGVVQRFVPSLRDGGRASARPGSGNPGRANPGSGSRPTTRSTPQLNPRTGGPAVGTGSTGVRTAAGNGAPRLVPRQNSLITGVRRAGYQPRVLANSCYGPVWDPYWNSCWTANPCWSPSLTWSVGIGWGSFGWGFNSWYPWHCYNSYWGTNCWAYHPRRWFWPSWCWTPTPLYVDWYTPASSVVVVERTVREAPVVESIVVGAADRSAATPADLARKYVALGDFYFREGRFSEAADSYARAKTYAPEDGTVHFALADAVFAVGDYHFAAFLIGEALRLDPALATADTDKRLLYGDAGLFEKQMQTLLRYLEDKPYDAMAHLVLGYNLKFSTRAKEAQRAFQRVLEIDPGNVAAQRFLAALTAPAEAAAEAGRGGGE